VTDSRSHLEWKTHSGISSQGVSPVRVTEETYEVSSQKVGARISRIGNPTYDG